MRRARLLLALDQQLDGDGRGVATGGGEVGAHAEQVEGDVALVVDGAAGVQLGTVGHRPPRSARTAGAPTARAGRPAGRRGGRRRARPGRPASARGHSAKTAGAPAVGQISTVGKPVRRSASASHAALSATSGACAGSAEIDGMRSQASRSACRSSRCARTKSRSGLLTLGTVAVALRPRPGVRWPSAGPRNSPIDSRDGVRRVAPTTPVSRTEESHALGQNISNARPGRRAGRRAGGRSRRGGGDAAGGSPPRESEGRFDSAAEKYESGEIELDSPDGEANGRRGRRGGRAARLHGAVRRGAHRAGHRRAGRVLRGLRGPPGPADATGQTWTELTRRPVQLRRPRYRDYDSNSSGGPGQVTGRMTAMAVDGGEVYAAGADGGVWRSTTAAATGSRSATSCPRSPPATSRSTRTGALWLGTGEANTSGDAYVGSGVYVLTNPTSAPSRPPTASAAPSWRAPASTSCASAATRCGRPPAGSVLPLGERHRRHPGSCSSRPTRTTCRAAPKADDPEAAYKNIVNDIAIDPRNAKHVIAAVGWRSGDTYNGFYESTRRRPHLDADQPRGGDQSPGHRLRHLRLRGRRLQALRHRPVGEAATTRGPEPRRPTRCRRHLRLQLRLPVRPVEQDRRLDQAGEQRLGAQAADRRQGLRPRRAGLVQPVPHGRPDERRPRVRGPRGGLRDDGRRLLVDDARPVLELLLPVLASTLYRAERQPGLLADHPLRPARGAIGTLPAASRTSTSATTAASTGAR